MPRLLVLAYKADIEGDFKHAWWSRHITHFALFSLFNLRLVEKVFRVCFCLLRDQVEAGALR